MAERLIIKITVFFVVTILVLFFITDLLLFLAAHPQVLVLLLGAVSLIGMCVLWVRQAMGPSTAHGSARYASLAEIKRAGMLFPTLLGKQQQWLFLGHIGGIPKRVIALRERVQQAHILMVAPTRAGKSTRVIIPNLLEERGTRSLLVNDLKGELAALCTGSLSRFMPCYTFAPTMPEQSAGYNPLTYVSGLEDAQDIAECIIRNSGGTSNEPFWDNAAKLLICAVLLHIKATERDAPFHHLIDLLSLSMTHLRDTITRSPSPLARQVASAFFSSVAHNERLSGSIMTDVQARLLSLKIPALQRVTSRNTIDLDTDKPLAIFLHIPADEAARLKWLSSCFVMQLMKRLVNRADHQKTWAFYLDELANMGYIPHYLEYLSYVGGLGISLIQAAQDFGQLERIYDQNGLSTILANSATQIVFPGCGLREATHYSESLGTTTTYSYGASWQQGAGRRRPTRNQTETQRKLMTPDEIRTLPEGRLIVFSKNLHPFQVMNTPYFREKRYVSRTKLAPINRVITPAKETPPRALLPERATTLNQPGTTTPTPPPEQPPMQSAPVPTPNTSEEPANRPDYLL